MSQKVNFPVRVSPELLERIKGKKGGMEETMSLALDALEREENVSETLTEYIEKLSDRMQKMESAFVGLAMKIKEFLPLVIESEDAAYRAQNSSRLMLAWGDLVVKNSGMPTADQWQKERTEILQSATEKRKDQLSKRKGN